MEQGVEATAPKDTPHHHPLSRRMDAFSLTLPSTVPPLDGLPTTLKAQPLGSISPTASCLVSSPEPSHRQYLRIQGPTGGKSQAKSQSPLLSVIHRARRPAGSSYQIISDRGDGSEPAKAGALLATLCSGVHRSPAILASEFLACSFGLSSRSSYNTSHLKCQPLENRSETRKVNSTSSA